MGNQPNLGFLPKPIYRINRTSGFHSVFMMETKAWSFAAALRARRDGCGRAGSVRMTGPAAPRAHAPVWWGTWGGAIHSFLLWGARHSKLRSGQPKQANLGMRQPRAKRSK